MNRRRALALLSVALAASCAAPATQDTRRAIDWAQAPIVVLRSGPSTFEPDHLLLRLHQPIRLVLVNGTGPTTDFETRFFGAARYRPGTQNPGLIVRLDPAQRVELDLVPVQPGGFPIQQILLAGGGSFPPGFIIVK